MASPAVKICGLTRPGDALLAAAAGARYAGVILAPGGKRSISVQDAAAVLADLTIERVGVFVDASPDEMRQAAESASLAVLQLHGDETPAAARSLRASGEFTLWKAVRVRGAEDLERAVERYSDSVDALLLDGWSPDAPGGTGTRFDWDALAGVRDSLPEGLALVVAGGLNPGNVARAIALLRPDVVDVSSGVESAPGVKDPVAIRAFIDAASPL